MQNLDKIAKSNYGDLFKNIEGYEQYNVISKYVMEKISDNWSETKKNQQKIKNAYYLSAEYLMGRALGNNLLNLKMDETLKTALDKQKVDLNTIEMIEEDAGLGNGGLGRLAACFLDSAATHDLPLHGYGIRYEYGMFKQKIVDGFQMEEADNWLKYGEPWSIRRVNESVKVVFGDQTVNAVPYDTPVTGYGTNTVNTLRLWKSEALEEFDFGLFNRQDYDDAVSMKNKAEDISRVLYPNDDRIEGKILRLKQEYFFVSASLQDLVSKFKAKKDHDFKKFNEFHAIQMNDTHPAVAVAELMRLLMAEGNLDWKSAWEVTTKTLAYTNHTVMAEALEQWNFELFTEVLPDVSTIIEKIDKQLQSEFKKKKAPAIIENGNIKMANLAIYGSHATNGVAWLHTEILKEKELNDWYKIYPERFLNKTNGITQRRWLALANPELSAFITDLLKSDKWITELDELKGLEKFKDDKKVLDGLMAIKMLKKEQLSKFIYEKEGVKIDPNSLFDIQIKRLHEYKRQLLNALHIIDLYYRIKENPKGKFVPRTFIFGAKAAPGYMRAKGIIKFINEIANLVNNDPDTKGKLMVHFVENYNVSYGQMLFPAADLSEQISAAGTEASGTGNMKFMLNGTPTIGTYDGANVEIVEAAGFDNNFIFGARVEELTKIKKTYDPKKYYWTTPGLKRSIDTLIDITFDDKETGYFRELYSALLKGASWHLADHYFILRDFDEYRKAHLLVEEAYLDKYKYAKMCLMNLANAGRFSSDRTIKEYASEIWSIK